MRYLKLKEQLLNEINMSPNALRRAAKEIGARAGMEFEMIVPGAAESEEGDDYLEHDMDSDERINSIQDAYDFFYDGDFNSRNDAQRLVDKMRDDYTEWLGGQVSDRWDADKEEAIYDWLRYNAAPSQVFEILGVEEDENGNFPDPTKDDYRNAAAKVLEDQISPWYEDAEQDFNDNFYSDTDLESEWLEHEGISTMWDVQNNYNITWPHYYNPDTGGEVSIEDAADSFSRAVGREVQASQNYHSRSVVRPSATELHYVVEPDGSLSADDDADGGLEFVSPALPIDELLDDLKKVKAWADKTGCYTNDSTGLHINVSVPAWQGDLSKLDYVKLAILMGDEYVLENFGRSGNTYAKSALKIVKDNIRQRPEDVKLLLDQMKEHLNTSAAKLIHSGSTSKYTSVNTKDGYIEFRSPGGDWLNENFDKIESTLLRFVVAMDAAVDETKYKEEYAKKLYKLLAGDQKDTTNTMAYFAKYAAGEMPAAALKSFIKQAQFERSVDKEPNGKKMWYRVDKEGRGKSGASVEVIATSKEEALQKAASEWSLKLSALSAAAVYPVRPFDNNADNWEIYNSRTGELIGTFKSVTPNGSNRDEAGDDYRTWRYNNGIRTTDPRSMSFRPKFDKNRYELFNLDRNIKLDEPVPSNVTTDEQALTFLDDYINHGPHGLQPFQAKRLIGIRRWGDETAEPILATPFHATSGEPQPAGSVGQDVTSPTGQWKIVDGLGREVYRFRPANNTEAKAKELAAAWAADGQFDGNYRVLPVGHNDNTPRPVPGVTDIEPDISTSSPVQGSTQDSGQHLATPGAFTGAWKILDTDTGRELYRFSGIGNSQADANRVAANWLRQNGPEDADMTQIEVVPVMR